MKIRIAGKVIAEGFDHYVLSMDTDKKIVENNLLTYQRIDRENMDSVADAIGKTTRKWILSDYEYAKGYVFYDPDQRQVGSCWLMLKGGDEKLYKIRKHESFIFRLEVDEQYRGQGYAKMILDHMIRIIREQGCDDVCLVCARKNSRALHVYESVGMKREGRKIFFRVLDHNIPYYEL